MMGTNQFRDETGGVHLFFPGLDDQDDEDTDARPDGGMRQQPLSRFEADLNDLTDAEAEVYRAVELRGQGVRSFARQTDRSPGTVGNLLGRARPKIGQQK